MKKLNSLYLSILLFAFLSCDFLDKFDHFGVGNTFERSFIINVDPNDVNTYSGFVSFDASDDATLDENLDNIKEFDIENIRYKITGFAGDDVAVANGTVSITSEGEQVGTSVTFENVNFSDLYAEDMEMMLPLTQATYAAIKEAYLSKQKIEIEVSGDYIVREPTELEFTLYMTVDALINM